MTDNTEAFEKWFYDLFPMGCKSAQLEHNLRGAWQAATAQAQARIAELEKDVNYIQDMFVKGYQLSYNAPVDWLTDEANKKLAWQVVRTIKPFCDSESNRAWVGSTPKEAIENCKKSIDKAIAESKQ